MTKMSQQKLTEIFQWKSKPRIGLLCCHYRTKHL